MSPRIDEDVPHGTSKQDEGESPDAVSLAAIEYAVPLVLIGFVCLLIAYLVCSLP